MIGRSNYSKNTQTFEMAMHAETEKAILVSLTGDEADAVWLPKSQVEFTKKGNHYEVEMSEQLAFDKKLI